LLQIVKEVTLHCGDFVFYVVQKLWNDIVVNYRLL
jgi:hypothetical protein